jgi:hypothetical protein
MGSPCSFPEFDALQQLTNSTCVFLFVQTIFTVPEQTLLVFEETLLIEFEET